MKIPKRPLKYMVSRQEAVNDSKYEHDPFYNAKRWRKVRVQFLNKNPLCWYCDKAETATVVDHLRPRRLWPELEWEDSNFVPSCYSCHQRKSGKETKITTQADWLKRMKGYLFTVDQKKPK